jgi:hypothetical protein
MQALINPLHKTPLGRILDFKCQCECEGSSEKEYTRNFSISFTRRGSFGYHVGLRTYDIHSGVVLLEKAGCEYTVTHRSTIKDECTIFELADEFETESAGQRQAYAGRGTEIFVRRGGAWINSGWHLDSGK